MADMKQEIKTEDQNYAVGTTTDPKNLQELTQYVSRLYCTLVKLNWI